MESTQSVQTLVSILVDEVGLAGLLAVLADVAERESTQAVEDHNKVLAGKYQVVRRDLTTMSKSLKGVM